MRSLQKTSKNQIRDEESGSILQSPFHYSNIAVKRLFATYNLIKWIEFLWQTIIFAVNENLFTLWKSARIIHSHCCRCHLRSVASVSRYTPWTKIWVTCHWICTWSISRLQAINRTPFQLQLIPWVVHNWQLKVLSLESSEDSNKPWIEAKGSKRKELLRLKWQLQKHCKSRVRTEDDSSLQQHNKSNLVSTHEKSSNPPAADAWRSCNSHNLNYNVDTPINTVTLSDEPLALCSLTQK